MLLVVLGVGIAGAVWLSASLPRPRSGMQTYAINSASMYPTIEAGEWIITSPGPIERGAVVVHADPRGPDHAPILKRIVAVAGDVVELRDGRLVLNGSEVPSADAGPSAVWERNAEGQWSESPCALRTETLGANTYRIACAPGGGCGEDLPPQRIPPGTVFVLGDRRDRSADSRYYGPIAEQSVISRASWIYVSRGPDGVRWSRIGRPVR